jgi:hypothetical protein
MEGEPLEVRDDLNELGRKKAHRERKSIGPASHSKEDRRKTKED